MYYLVPARDYTERNAFIRVAIGGVLLVCVLVWQIRRIVRAPVPELRAIEALVAVISLFLVLFATTYLSLSLTTPAAFNQHLDHTRALYFTIEVFSTVGFGDIVPRTNPVRILVTTQMLLNLVIIGAVVKILATAARTGLERTRRDHQGPES
ncbi:potassium channel family protein [Rhodococcus sp. LB1]|uniref:potassium channel family protein n=1 Tax=Rhodococcus sp. LB1 TaxID=1807499 RepID=UPI001E4B0075|nr:potassium channel family protein [Rhodococcus sp. LB1]